MSTTVVTVSTHTNPMSAHISRLLPWGGGLGGIGGQDGGT